MKIIYFVEIRPDSECFSEVEMKTLVDSIQFLRYEMNPDLNRIPFSSVLTRKEIESSSIIREMLETSSLFDEIRIYKDKTIKDPTWRVLPIQQKFAVYSNV